MNFYLFYIINHPNKLQQRTLKMVTRCKSVSLSLSHFIMHNPSDKLYWCQRNYPQSWNDYREDRRCCKNLDLDNKSLNFQEADVPIQGLVQIKVCCDFTPLMSFELSSKGCLGYIELHMALSFPHVAPIGCTLHCRRLWQMCHKHIAIAQVPGPQTGRLAPSHQCREHRMLNQISFLLGNTGMGKGWEGGQNGVGQRQQGQGGLRIGEHYWVSTVFYSSRAWIRYLFFQG